MVQDGVRENANVTRGGAHNSEEGTHSTTRKRKSLHRCYSEKEPMAAAFTECTHLPPDQCLDNAWSFLVGSKDVRAGYRIRVRRANALRCLLILLRMDQGLPLINNYMKRQLVQEINGHGRLPAGVRTGYREEAMHAFRLWKYQRWKAAHPGSLLTQADMRVARHAMAYASYGNPTNPGPNGAAVENAKYCGFVEWAMDGTTDDRVQK